MICSKFTSSVVLLGVLNLSVYGQSDKSALTNAVASTSNYTKTEKVEQESTWEFHEAPLSKADDPECTEAQDDFFGKEIACLRLYVDKRFVEKEEVVPGDPTVRTTILKPDIYKAVRSIEKHYKKSPADASAKNTIQENYKYILRVALAVAYARNTGEFEKALGKERKNVANQISLFRKVKLL